MNGALVLLDLPGAPKGCLAPVTRPHLTGVHALGALHRFEDLCDLTSVDTKTISLQINECLVVRISVVDDHRCVARYSSVQLGTELAELDPQIPARPSWG